MYTLPLIPQHGDSLLILPIPHMLTSRSRALFTPTGENEGVGFGNVQWVGVHHGAFFLCWAGLKKMGQLYQVMLAHGS